MDIKALWQLREDALMSKVAAMAVVSVFDKVLLEFETARRHLAVYKEAEANYQTVTQRLRGKLELCQEALRSTPCTCRPHGVLNTDGSRTNYACLRCLALEEKK